MKNTIFTTEHIELVRKLNVARHDAGLTQKDVSIQLKTTQSYISKIESGQVKIDFITLQKLADIYKKNIKYFTKNFGE